jgi:hypothetical protein
MGGFKKIAVAHTKAYRLFVCHSERGEESHFVGIARFLAALGMTTKILQLLFVIVTWHLILVT